MKELRRHGFTLIELLVTIAIIALLLGIMVPVLGNAKRLARGAVCASNMHSLMVGVSQYQAAHGHQTGGGIPRQWVADTYWGVWWGEDGQANLEAGDIWDYVEQPGVYLCPEAEMVAQRPPRGSECAPGIAYGAEYYGPGGCIVPAFNPSQLQPVRSYAMSDRFAEGWRAVKDHQAIFLVEIHPWRDLDQTVSYGIARAHAGLEETPAHYHGGEANCAYFAGHVKRLAPDEIVAGLTPPPEELPE